MSFKMFKVLDEADEVIEVDIKQYEAWMASDGHSICHDVVEKNRVKVEISTIFLIVGTGKGQLFETAVFSITEEEGELKRGDLIYSRRYYTAAGARAGHQEILDKWTPRT